MFSANEISSPEFQTSDDNSRKSFMRRGIAVLCAVAITAAILTGYAYLRWRHAERLRAETASQNQEAKPIPSPQIQIFLDDAMIKGSEAVIGGTLQNISTDTLTGLAVELELKHRKDGRSEVRVLPVSPADLQPQQQGRYSLSVPSREYSLSRVQRVLSPSRPGEVPFKILPGAQRPDERFQPKEAIVVKPSPRRGKGDEFINTPDNPVSVP